MNGNLPTYRKWLSLFLLGLCIFGLLTPLSEPVDKILSFVLVACLLALAGSIQWEERRERNPDQSA